MLWIKAFHIIFMVAWFSGLFYLPRLYVYHAMCKDEPGNNRFKIMERKLYYGIATPSGALTLISGLLLLSFNPTGYMSMGWMHLKLGLVALLVIYHIYLGKLLYDFKRNHNRHRHQFYRWINEVPLLFLVLIVILVVVRPI